VPGAVTGRGDRHVQLWALAHRVLGEPDVVPPSGTHLMQSAAGASRHLWGQGRKPLHFAHARRDLALSRGYSAPDPYRPVGRWAEASRYAPRTTFYPCQSRGRLGTQYCIRQRRKHNRASEVPHLSKRWVDHPEPSRALHQRAYDVSERCFSLGCRCLLRYSPALRRGPPPAICHPSMPHKRMRAPPPWLAGRLRVVSSWRPQESPRSAHTARGQ
jgi:hypothetical protein